MYIYMYILFLLLGTGTGKGGGEGRRGEMLSSMNYSKMKRNGFERKPPKNKKQRFDWCVTMIIHLLYQKVRMIPRSIHTLWYKGSAENKEKKQLRKRTMSFKRAAQKRRLIFRKSQC